MKPERTEHTLVIFKENLTGKEILKVLEESDKVFKWLEGQDPTEYLGWVEDYDCSCELMAFVLQKSSYSGSKYYISYKIIDHETIENIFENYKNIYFFEGDILYPWGDDK
jgi:hypothetical protein